jgi:hypothetical protein
MPTFRRNVAPSHSRFGKPSGPPHSIISHKIRILISRLLMFERKVTGTLSSNIDHHIAMCRVLHPGGVASRDSAPVRAAAQHNRRWTQTSSSRIPEVQKRVRAFKICLEIPLLHLVLVERFPDAEALQWLRTLYYVYVYGLSLRCLEFDPRPTTSTYCEHVSPGQDFSLRLQFSPVTTILATLHTHTCIHSSSTDAA